MPNSGQPMWRSTHFGVNPCGVSIILRYLSPYGENDGFHFMDEALLWEQEGGEDDQTDYWASVSRFVEPVRRQGKYPVLSEAAFLEGHRAGGEGDLCRR